MKKIHINIVIIIALILYVVLCMASCNNINSVSENSDAEYTTEISIKDNEDTNIYPKNYWLICDNGEYYLQFDDNSEISYSDNSNCEEVPSLKFDNLDIFVSTIRNADFSQEQLKAIANFPKKDGKIKIFDVNNIYYPTINGEMADITRIYWTEGTGYSYLFEYNDVVFSARTLSKTRYEEEISNISSILENANEVFCDSVLDDGKRVIEYKTAFIDKMKYVEYTYSYESRIVTLKKTYILSDNRDDHFVSDNIPYIIEIVCCDGDLYYFMDISQLTEDIPDEVLISFAMEKYPEFELKYENTLE